MNLQKQYTDLREVRMKVANQLISEEGFELLYITQDRYWEKCPESTCWGMRAQVRYVVGRPK